MVVSTIQCRVLCIQIQEDRFFLLKTFHNLNFNKIKYPKFIDNSKEIKSSDEISFGAVRQEIFQNGEDVINEFDVKTYFITHNLKG